MREDITKLDKLDAQTRFMAKNNISTIEDLNKYRESATADIEKLGDERKKLKKENTPDIKERLKAISGQIKELRADIKICSQIYDRCQIMETELEKLEENKNYDNKNYDKEEDNELRIRRSRSGREIIS